MANRQKPLVWEVRLGRLWPVALIVIGAVGILGGRDSAGSSTDVTPTDFTSDE